MKRAREISEGEEKQAEKQAEKQDEKKLKPSGKSCTIFADGACKGNPGKGGAGAYIVFDQSSGGPDTVEVRRFVGNMTTNNIAEYTSLIAGLETALSFGASVANIHMDSMLVVNHVNGSWRCKQPHLQKLLVRVRALIKKFNRVRLVYIPREQNKEADRLANEAVYYSKEAADEATRN